MRKMHVQTCVVGPDDHQCRARATTILLYKHARKSCASYHVPGGFQTFRFIAAAPNLKSTLHTFSIPTRGINQYRWRLMERRTVCESSATNNRHIIIWYVNAGSLSQPAYTHAPSLSPPLARRPIHMRTTTADEPSVDTISLTSHANINRPLLLIQIVFYLTLMSTCSTSCTYSFLMNIYSLPLLSEELLFDKLIITQPSRNPTGIVWTTIVF